jgi:hypothetical protein
MEAKTRMERAGIPSLPDLKDQWEKPEGARERSNSGEKRWSEVYENCPLNLCAMHPANC